MTKTQELLELAARYEEAAMWAISAQAATTRVFRPAELLDVAARAAPAFAVAATLRARSQS